MNLFYQAKSGTLFNDRLPVGKFKELAGNDKDVNIILNCFAEEDFPEWIFDPLPPKHRNAPMMHKSRVERACSLINNEIICNKIRFEHSHERIYLVSA